jgi:hypothetical protein
MRSVADHAVEIRRGTIRHSRKQDHWRLRRLRYAQIDSGGFASHRPARSRFPAEHLFESDGVAAIVIIAAAPAKPAIAEFAVERDGAGIPLMNFKAHCSPSAPLRCVFRRRQKKRTGAAPADMRGHREE